MVVVVAILAVMVLVLAPKLLSYNERSRAEKDNSSMDEVVNAIQLALADQEIYDEVLRFSTVDNVSCYVDTNSEANYSKVVTKSNPDGVDQYTFTSSARQLDETPYFAAGNMRGVTITFAPDKGSNGSDFDLKQGVVNQYVQVSGNQRFGAMPKLYNRVRSSVGDVITNTSQTYRNSEYTVFIVMGTIGGNDESAQDATKFYGQWSGTNLPAQVSYQLVTDRVVGDTGNTIVDVDDSNWNQTNGNKLTLKPGDLNGGGAFTPTTSTGNQCLHENTEIINEDDTHTGDTVCVDCEEIIIESACKHIHVEVRNSYLPTINTQGYSGDKYCLDCNELLEQGALYDCTHETTEIRNKTASYTGDEYCTVCDKLIQTGESMVAGLYNIDNVLIVKYENSGLKADFNFSLNSSFSDRRSGHTTLTDYYTNTTRIILPEGLTTIGTYAFNDCENLTSIVIPNSVITISRNAFQGTGLTSVTVPESVTTIGYQAFLECDKLKSITLPSRITVIENQTFDFNTSLKDIIIPEGVTRIGQYAFRNCWSLTTINIPDTVTEIGQCAFICCKNLTSITYKGRTYSGYDWVNSLKSALTSNGVAVGYDAFRDVGY